MRKHFIKPLRVKSYLSILRKPKDINGFGIFRFLILIVFSFLFSGCLHYGFKGSTSSLHEKPSKEITFFSYRREPIKPSLELEKKERRYELLKVQFPSDIAVDNKTATAHYYKPLKKSPVVVILPVLGGNFYSQYFAKHLANKGFAVLRFERKGDFPVGKKGLLYNKTYLKKMVIDVRQGIDWLVEQKEIDKERIGIMGVSLGAIVGALVAGVDSRIKASAFLLGGGDIALVLTTSKEKGIKKFRREIMEQRNLSLDAFHREAAKVYKEVDPLTYATRLDPQTILMMNALWDKVIVHEASKKLWEECRRPELIRVFSGHYSAFLYLPYARYKVIKHFKKTLRME